MGDRSRTDAEQRSDVRLLHGQQTGIRSGPGQSAAADDQFGQADHPRMAAPAGVEGHDIVRHEESLRQRLHLHQVRAHTQHTPVLHAAGRKRRTAHQGPRQRRMVRRRHDRIRSGNRFQPMAASDKRLQPLGRDRPIQGAAARQRRPVALLLRKRAGKRQAQMAGRVGRQPAHILSGRQRPRRSGIPRRQALRHLYRSGGILYLEHRGKPRKRYDSPAASRSARMPTTTTMRNAISTTSSRCASKAARTTWTGISTIRRTPAFTSPIPITSPICTITR